MSKPTAGEVEHALAVLESAGWVIELETGHGVVMSTNVFLRTHPDSMPGTHEPHYRRVVYQRWQRGRWP